MAGFDLYFTLVKPKDNRKLLKNASDWEWTFDKVPDTLRKLVADKYVIVVFCNQFVINHRPDKIAEMKMNWI